MSAKDDTPTTETIRWDFGSYVDWRREEREAEFDRWLAAHDAQVAVSALEEAYFSGHITAAGLTACALPYLPKEN